MIKKGALMIGRSGCLHATSLETIATYNALSISVETELKCVIRPVGRASQQLLGIFLLCETEINGGLGCALSLHSVRLWCKGLQ